MINIFSDMGWSSFMTSNDEEASAEWLLKRLGERFGSEQAKLRIAMDAKHELAPARERWSLRPIKQALYFCH
jgi:hypothetical protein